MISIDKALLRQLLLIERPWEVREYQFDPRKRRCDVWVAPEVERGWFGRERKPAASTLTGSWRHLSIGPIQCHLHVALPPGQHHPGLEWLGEPGMPFTRALSQRVFAMFNQGVSLQSVCTLMDLSLQDVWRYRYAIDSGRPSGVAEAPVAASPAAAPRAPWADEPGHPNVPDLTDPVWMRLLNAEMGLDIRVLSLKLMLTRVRSQLELINDEEVRLLKLRELHRYFVKNERVLTHELAQLRQG
ncbi:hypothetical protein H010_03522 [Hydrogenophaga taeniospiralis CCUG 15921]|uniref:Uncharacterized protein n=1 Tax=Hydrogenophaga taeniospiralis CCUG 15921 TaxID=1281780 RepID=A0A9X4NN43_9BURK|nr:hypothetical protein [Hydrogenophaga taeniospiralis]MDG5974305.1 hypothetical protein [Hydrogenophaga taeniospiralis CCUG 15921]